MADTLESRVCGQCFDCPDGYHSSDELPCSCTADCVLAETCRSADCDASLDDGEGQDGYCGNCADRLACEEHGEIECEECN